MGRLSGDELIAERRLPAEPGRVWTAFTTPAGIAAFWGGSHATVTVDLRPGGEFALDTKAPGGRVHRLTFVYRTITEPDELVFEEPATGIRTTVTIRPDGADTHLTVHQRRLPPDLQTAQAASGLDAILDALAIHLERPSRREIVAEYFEGFRKSDHQRILATLTEDVEWIIHGHRTTLGKTEFDAEIGSPAFTGSPDLDVHRVFEDGEVVITTGEGRATTADHAPFHFAFSDLFTFQNNQIAKVDSYVVPL